MGAEKYRLLLEMVKESKDSMGCEFVSVDTLEQGEEIKQFREIIETIYSDDCYYNITRS